MDLTVVQRNDSKAIRVVVLFGEPIVASNCSGTRYGKVKAVPRSRRNESRALAYRKIESGLGSLMRFLEWSEVSAAIVECSVKKKCFFCGVVWCGVEEVESDSGFR